MSRSQTIAITLRMLVSGSCIDTRLMPLMPSVLRRKFRNSGSMPISLIRLDSDGVTCEMIEVRMASLRRVMAVTSMKALNSCRFTWPCDSPNGASGSRYSVSMKPSITISASAGTNRSTVLAFTTLIGAPTSAPATCSSSSVSGNFCTEAKVTTGGAPSTTAQGSFLKPRSRNFSQWL